jgi:hypothetical protein
VLKALLQLCAARLAGVPRFVFHTLSGADACLDAQALVEELTWGPEVSTDALIDAVLERGFVWGTSDGN